MITDRGVSGRATSASMSASDGSVGNASLLRAPHLAAMLSGFLQRQRGGDGSSPEALRATRRLGPGHYTNGLQHADDAPATVSSAVIEPMSLYRLRLARSQPQPQRLFSAAHGFTAGTTLEAADSFDVDVDIELLPVGSAFLASVGGDAWLHGAATVARSILQRAALEVASVHAAARTWTCAHRRLLLALLAAQLALTALLALAARMSPGSLAKRRAKAALRFGVVDAADEVHTQLSQPLLREDADVYATNPMRGMLATVNTR